MLTCLFFRDSIAPATPFRDELLRIVSALNTFGGLFPNFFPNALLFPYNLIPFCRLSNVRTSSNRNFTRGGGLGVCSLRKFRILDVLKNTMFTNPRRHFLSKMFSKLIVVYPCFFIKNATVMSDIFIKKFAKLVSETYLKANSLIYILFTTGAIS